MEEQEMVSIDIVITGLASGKATKVHVPKSQAPEVYVEHPPVEHFMMNHISVPTGPPTIHFNFVPFKDEPGNYLYTVTKEE